ncbi:SIMPL domain-containing protein [Halopenitus sp. H-Gu1]|uniref:SIMPL domain-containing protein n=1 Tax=Halopenitus sp. H-Gu1 TaxID=3242697 RepID=UPI00359CD687
MDRRLIGALAIVVVVLLAGCAGIVGSADAPDEAEPERTVEVTASGEATAEPDRATITVAVEARGDSPQAVREEIANDDEALRAALAEWGLEDDQIRTTRYDVRQERPRPEDDSDGSTQYVGIHQYELEIHDVDAVGEVIDVSIDAGADRVQRIQFGLSDERESELRTTAFENAVENADANARTLANSTGLEIVDVYTISTTDHRVSPYTARADAAVAEEPGDGGAPTRIESGEVTVNVDVHIVFEAESGA